MNEILDTVYRVLKAIKYNRDIDKKDFKLFKNYIKKKFVFNKDDGFSAVVLLIIQRRFFPKRQYIAHQIYDFVVDVQRGIYAKISTNKRDD